METLSVNGKTYEFKEQKRNDRMVRFQVWEAGNNINGVDAVFHFKPFFNQDTEQTITGWDLELAVDYKGSPLPAEFLSVLAESKGLTVR